MASEYPFTSVLGVELLPDLHQIAMDNIARYRGGLGARVRSICTDARRFEFPPQPSVLFLFNPFPEPVLEAVLTNLEGSLRAHPRVVYLIYHNPVLEGVVVRRSGMRMIRRHDQFSVFVAGL
jgi:hypothetical protein